MAVFRIAIHFNSLCRCKVRALYNVVRTHWHREFLKKLARVRRKLQFYRFTGNS